MIFVDRRAFQDRKVLVVVIRTSDVSEDQGCASIYVSASSNQRRRIGIDERRAVEEIVRGHWTVCSVRVFSATARLGVGNGRGLIRNRRLKRTVIGSQNRHARHNAQAKSSVRARWRIAECIENRRGTTLVAKDAANSPSTKNFAGHTLVKVWLAAPCRQFIEIADDQSVGRILITEGLLRLRVERILSCKLIRRETRKDRDSTVRICQRFRVGVRGQQI